MTQPNNLLTKIFQGVAVLAIAALFVGLGFWQLQRAADLKNSLKVATTIDTQVVQLESVTTPRVSLPPAAINKTVAPSLASSLAVAAPIPLDAPVIKTVLLYNEFFISVN